MLSVSIGFRACGIYPFDPSIIPEQAFAPSEVTNRDIANVSSGNSTNSSVDAQSSPSNVINSSTSSNGPSTSSSVSSNEPPATTPASNDPQNSLQPSGSQMKSIIKTPTMKNPVKERKRAVNCRAVILNTKLFEDEEEGEESSCDSDDEFLLSPKNQREKMFKKLLAEKFAKRRAALKNVEKRKVATKLLTKKTKEKFIRVFVLLCVWGRSRVEYETL